MSSKRRSAMEGVVPRSRPRRRRGRRSPERRIPTSEQDERTSSRGPGAACVVGLQSGGRRTWRARFGGAVVKSYETVQPVPFGSYQLVERLAMGGMAEVYLARPDGQQRFVALKRILPNIAADDEFIAMFIDEPKIAGQPHHPNVAQLFDMG